MGKTYTVVGAGFRGFCDCVQLLREPGATIQLVDREPFFGGMSYSTFVKGFYVDKGVHMFDSITPDLAEIVSEIMDGKVRKIDFVSMSAFNGHVTDGFSLPDLASFHQEIKDSITREFLSLASLTEREMSQ
ncbi:MAG: NAD(P)/FAD-dependent oxidoreductase, partial [Bdellovibrionales bacterium]|nr:NAD(P)/FAD-dependent oxidoreductase [Bdellovibrionales bacterium]